MDVIQLFVVDLGWFFFAAWTTGLIAISLVAFGGDILAFTGHSSGDSKN